MKILPRCPRCNQPLAIIEDGDSHETYCPDCLSVRPTWASFEAWMQAVDDALVRKVGVASSDLPDIAYRDLYDSGSSPQEAADSAIEDAIGG